MLLSSKSNKNEKLDFEQARNADNYPILIQRICDFIEAGKITVNFLIKGHRISVFRHFAGDDGDCLIMPSAGFTHRYPKGRILSFVYATCVETKTPVS